MHDYHYTEASPTEATDRLYRDAERRLCWQTWAPILHAAWVLGLALACVLAFAYNGCGDMRDAHAEPVPTMTEPEAHPDASQPIPSDPEADALAARFLAWQPTWRPRRAGDLEAVVSAILTACRANPWPTPERCPDLTLVLVFRESSLRPEAVGRRGELGLMQLLPGVATAGETREAVLDPERNVRLGLAHLRRAQTMCRFVGRGDVSTALGMYGSGRCRAYRGSRLVERWETELREGAGSGT